MARHSEEEVKYTSKILLFACHELALGICRQDGAVNEPVRYAVTG